MLKPPIVEQCSKAGLRGCDELTDGVLAYVEGDKDGARRKIEAGAAKNAPSQVKKFAIEIRKLRSIPGAEDYIGPLLDAADILAGAEPKHAKTHGDAADDDTASSERSDDAEPRRERHSPSGAGSLGGSIAGTVVPVTSERAYSCRIFGDTNWDAELAAARCVAVVDGPAILTDVQTTGECHDLLAIGAGDPQKPRWVLIGEPAMALAIHGAHFVTGTEENLFVVQAGGLAATLGRGPECSLSWAAQR